MRDVLGLEANEQVVGLIHLGSAVSEPPVKERAELDELLRTLP